MSKDPAFLFYTQDFYTGTVFFTDEQVGKYIRLLCLQHQTGHLEEKHMINICKTYDFDIFSKFKRDSEGKYYNERLDSEINRRTKYSNSRRENRLSKKTYVEHMETETKDIDIGGVGEKEIKIPIEDKHFEFYAREVSKAKEFTDKMSQDYISFCNHVCQTKDGAYRLPHVLKIKNQISLDEFSKLHKKAGGKLETIIDKIDSLQTNVKYHGKYTDLYLTINKWLNDK